MCTFGARFKKSQLLFVLHSILLGLIIQPATKDPGCLPGSFCDQARRSRPFQQLACLRSELISNLNALSVTALSSSSVRLAPKFKRLTELAAQEKFVSAEVLARQILADLPWDNTPAHFTIRELARSYEGSAPLARAPLSKAKRQWYNKHLRAMREPSLEPNGPETHRFLWLRSFNLPVVVRVVLNEPPKLIVKVMSGNSSFAGGLCERRERVLSIEETRAVRTCFKQAAVWRAAPKQHFGGAPSIAPRHRFSHEDLLGIETGIDGAEWIVESVFDDRYWFRARWSPEQGALRTCALVLLELSGVHREP